MMKHPLTAREAPLELATQLRGEEEKRRIPITGLGSGTVGGGVTGTMHCLLGR